MAEPTKPKTYVICADCGRGHDGACTEPTKLLSAEEFETLLSSVACDHAYAAALTALHEVERMLKASVNLTDEAIKQRDSALARVAELEAEIETQCDKYGLPPSVAVLEQHLTANAALAHEFNKSTITLLRSERDALAAELSELRAGIAFLVETAWEADAIADACENEDTASAIRNIARLASQPQGERGKALLAERAAFKDALLQALFYNVRGIGTKDAFYVCSTPPKGVLPEWVHNALAAIDGAQPEPPA